MNSYIQFNKHRLSDVYETNFTINKQMFSNSLLLIYKTLMETLRKQRKKKILKKHCESYLL